MRLLVALMLVTLCVPSLARATTGGPNSFQVLGVDSKAGKLFLKESVGGESGDFRLWTLDLKAPAAAPVIAAFKPASVPAGLEQPTQLALNELALSGQIVAQSLVAQETTLLHKFDLKVELAWNGAKVSVDLVGYRHPTVNVVGAMALPGNRCALGLVSSMGKPEEGGYELQKPVLVCSDKALPNTKLDAVRQAPKPIRR